MGFEQPKIGKAPEKETKTTPSIEELIDTMGGSGEPERTPLELEILRKQANERERKEKEGK